MRIDKVAYNYKDIAISVDFKTRTTLHDRVRLQIPQLYFYRDIIISSNRVIDLDRIRDILCGR